MAKTSSNKTKEKKIDLNDYKYYNNRELSWLDFNFRVLEEAYDTTNPLLERVRFLSITSSNLEEFFMIRVAGLEEQLQAGFSGVDISGLNPRDQLMKISQKTHKMVEMQYNCLENELLPSLEKENIKVLKVDDIDEEKKSF